MVCLVLERMWFEERNTGGEEVGEGKQWKPKVDNMMVLNHIVVFTNEKIGQQ